MKFKNHFVANAALSILFNLPLLPFLGFMAGSTLPDTLDKVFSVGDRELWKRIHRTLSHWPWLYVAGVAIVILSGGDGEVGSMALWACLGSLAHLALDVLTPMGIPVFPWSLRKRRSIRLFRTGSFWEYAFLLALVVLGGYAGMTCFERGDLAVLNGVSSVLADGMDFKGFTW